jgi:hypothetical protein
MSYLQKSAAKKHKKSKTDDAVVKMQETIHTRVNPAASHPPAVAKSTFGRRSGTR